MSFDIVIGWEPYNAEFRGHEIEMQLRPLKTWASLLLTPIFKKTTEKVLKAKKEKQRREAEGMAEEQPEEKEPATEEEINFVYEIQGVSKKVFPDHLKGFAGLTINKLAVTIEDLCEETAFGPLCMDIIGELAKRSQLPEIEVKNSKGPLPTPTNAEENTQEP